MKKLFFSILTIFTLTSCIYEDYNYNSPPRRPPSRPHTGHRPHRPNNGHRPNMPNRPGRPNKPNGHRPNNGHRPGGR